MAKDRASSIAAWAAIIAAVGNVGAMAWTQKPWWIAGEADKQEIEDGRKAIRELELIKLREELRAAERPVRAPSPPPFIGPPPPMPAPVPLPPAAAGEVMAMSSAPEPTIWPRALLSVILVIFGAGFLIYKAFKKKSNQSLSP